MTTPTPLSPAVEFFKAISDPAAPLRRIVYGNYEATLLHSSFVFGALALMLVLGFFWFRSLRSEHISGRHLIFGALGALMAFGVAYALTSNPLRFLLVFGLDDAGEWDRAAREISVLMADGAAGLFAPIFILGALPVFGVTYLTGGDASGSYSTMSDSFAYTVTAFVGVALVLLVFGLMRLRILRHMMSSFVFWTIVIYVLFPLISFLMVTMAYVAVFLIFMLAMAGAGGVTRVARR